MMRSLVAHRSLAGILLASLCAVPAALAAAGGSGGGSVSNGIPTVDSFSIAGGSAQTRLVTGVMSGTIQDANGEARLSQVSVQLASAPLGVSPTRFDRAITAADRSQATEPAAFGADGWKVWNSGGHNDGTLSFRFQHLWSASGAYTVRALVQDQVATDRTGPAADLAIVVSDGFTVAADPVLANGTPDTSAAWGGWSALPGAGPVDGANYLKVTNTGSNPAQAFTIDFSAASFTGADGATAFALDGNVRIECLEATPGQAPTDLGFDLAEAALSSTGSRTLAFTATGNSAYCAYRIDALPTPLLDQAYTAAFTVS